MTECPMCHHIFDGEREKKRDLRQEIIDDLIDELKRRRDVMI